MNDYGKIIECCSYFLDQYPRSYDCKQYLNSRLSVDTQKVFGFGYFPQGKEIRMLLDYFDKDNLVNLNLLYEKIIENSQSKKTILNSFFENYPLVMPYRDHYGRNIAIVGRVLMDEDTRKQNNLPKYKNTVFKKSHHLFGLYENGKSIIEEDCVVIVEGQFDVMGAYEHGLKNVVAVGSSNMSAYQFSLIKRYTDNIYLLLDNDEAGNKGRDRIISKYNKYGKIKNIFIPNKYKDIFDYFSDGNTVDDFWSL